MKTLLSVTGLMFLIYFLNISSVNICEMLGREVEYALWLKVNAPNITFEILGKDYSLQLQPYYKELADFFSSVILYMSNKINSFF